LLAFVWLASFAFVKSYAGIFVAALALIAACSSNKPSTTPQPNNGSQPGPVVPNSNNAPDVDVNATGAPNARGAAQAFLDAGKAQDLQALSAVWGNTTGPLRNSESHDRLEKRELIMMCFFRFDTDSIGSPSAAPGSRIVFPVTLRRGAIAAATTITTVPGPSSRWYVETIDLPKIEKFCQK
jgi:hypothetical protein